MSPFIYFMAISSIVGALSEQIGIFFSNIFFTSFDTGLLASASRVSAVFVVIAGSVGSVLVPRASRYTDTANIKAFAKKTLLLGLMLFMLCIPVILFPKFVILVTSGSEYFKAQNLLVILTVSSAITVFRASFGSVFYGLGNGKIFVYTSVLNLFLEVPLTFLLADVFGLVGIAWTRLILQMFLLSFTMVFFFMRIRSVSAKEL